MNDKPIHILHLLSWFPTPDDPTKGNFCLRQIEAVSLFCPSVVLSVYINCNINKKRVLLCNTVDNYTQITIQIKSFRSPWLKVNSFINKVRIFMAYNGGLKYIQKNIFKVDLVHLHVALPAGKIALFWKIKYKIPFILSEHWSVYTPQDTRLKKNNIKKTILRINKYASSITVVSNRLKTNMQLFGIKNEIEIIPNVIDVEIFNSINKPNNTIIQILHVSSLNDDEKNFSGILRVINRLKDLRIDFVLNVIHDYDYTEYKSYIEENQLSKYVIFHGKKSMEDLATGYQKADFLVMFSNFETFSCVVMESLACGTPVLATETGAIPEMIDNKRGIVISAGDEEALFQKMNFMLDNYSTFSKNEMSQFIKQNFTKEIVGKQFATIYKKCLNSKNQ